MDGCQPLNSAYEPPSAGIFKKSLQQQSGEVRVPAGMNSAGMNHPEGEEPQPDCETSEVFSRPLEDADDLILPWWVGYDALLSVVAFLVFNRWVSLTVAIIATTVIGAAGAALRARMGVAIGVLLPLVIAAVLVRGVVGIIADNEDVYFGIGIFYKYCIALGVALSVPLKWRFVDISLRRTLGINDEVCHLPEFRKPVDRTLIAFGLILAGSATFDIWLLGQTSANSYVLIRLLINWPLYVLVVALGLYFLAKSLARVPGYPGMLSLLEAQALRKRARQRPPEVGNP